VSALEGFVRPTRRPGARNYVFVVPSVVCSTLLARQIADAVGAVTVSHQHGCGHIGPDITQARDLFVGLAANPNVADALIASLGCETVQGKHVAAELQRRGHPGHLVGIQDSGGHDAALQAGIAIASDLVAATERAARDTVSIDQLTLGIVASQMDPRVQGLLDRAVAAGIRVVIAADTGASELVPDHARPVAIGEADASPVSYVTNAGSGAQLLAAAASCGAQVLVDFPDPSQPPQGFAVAPVISVAADTGLHPLISEDFDLDATVDSDAILAEIIDVFGGKPVKAELRGSSAFAIPRMLRTM
jgi:altronate dehydratase